MPNATEIWYALSFTGTLQAVLSLLRLNYTGFAVGLVAILIGAVFFCMALGACSRALSENLVPFICITHNPTC